VKRAGGRGRSRPPEVEWIFHPPTALAYNDKEEEGEGGGRRDKCNVKNGHDREMDQTQR